MDLFPLHSKNKSIKDSTLEGFSLKRAEGDYFPPDQKPKGLLVSSIEKKRVYVLSLVIIILFIILGGRMIWLQVIGGNKYRNIAEGNRIRIARIEPDRGLIYDKNLNPLVKNIAHFSITVTPGDLPRDDEKQKQIIDSLIQIVEQTPNQNPAPEQARYGAGKYGTGQAPNETLRDPTGQAPKETLRDPTGQAPLDDEKEMIDIEYVIKNASPYSYQPIIIKNDLLYSDAMRLLIQLEDLYGVSLVTSARRNYIQSETGVLLPEDRGGIFSHIVGYVGKISQEEHEQYSNYGLNEFIGKTGLELYYEELLRGKFGQKIIEVNSLGKEERIESHNPPQSGYDLILSIDGELQKKIAHVLAKYIKNAGSHGGAAVALHPKTGEVLALVSFPNYDNNIFISGTQNEYQMLENDPYKPFVFRAISGEYAPGSIVKPVIATGALSEGIIDEYTTINSYGGLTVGQWFFADWKEGGHGLTDVIKALAESVNTFFYYIGGGFKNFKGLGIENINTYAHLFGLSQKTGIDIPGEREGFIANPRWKQEIKKEKWYIGDTYHISIGQGDILVTPIQVARYTAAIANGGMLLRPYLVTYIQNPQNGEIQQVNAPTVIKSASLKQEDIDIVKKGMRAAVTQGSAIRLSYLPVSIAGKTGTAQVGGDKKPHAWFTGFAPYEDPEIVLTILVENGGEGSAVAVPAAYEILDWWERQR